MIYKMFKKYYMPEFDLPKSLKIKLIKSQKELLLELASGKTIPEIAQKLDKTPNNIKKRTLNLYKKFNVHYRKELLLKAIEQKIISYKNISPRCRKRFLKSDNIPVSVEVKTPNNLELSEKEYNFLLLLSQSYTRKQIMKILNFYNMHDCNYYYHCMLNKLNAKNAIQAVVVGIKYGIIKI